MYNGYINCILIY